MKKKIDIWIVLSIIILQTFSLINLIGTSPENLLLLIIYTIIGSGFFIISFRVGLKCIKDYTVLLYYLFIFLFIITIFLGFEVRGAKRWIDFPVFNFQPSEFFKPIFLIILSKSIIKTEAKNIALFISILLILIIPLLLIYFQPDLANTLVYISVLFIILFLAGFSLKYFGLIFIVLSLIGPILWNLLKEYQRMRFLSFINPQIDPLGLNYNINQSIIALGSGNFLGRGLGLATQSNLHFLPEHHTDFAFASLVEQFGFIGGIIVIILFFVIIYRLLQKVRQQDENSISRYYLIGCVLFIFIAFFINIGMNMGLLPVAGITLPFISYGGSSFVSMMIMLGFAFSI